MIKLYPTIIAFILFATQALAFNQKDLDELKFLQSCRQCDLNGADLSGMNFGNGDFHGANLEGAKLAGAYLNEANFRFANLSGAKIGTASLYRANFEHAKLIGVDFTEASVDHPWCATGCIRRIHAVRFNAAVLRNTNFSGLYIWCGTGMITDADFTGAKLIGTRFHKCDLSGSNFTDADMTGVKFGGSKIEGAIFCRTKTSVDEKMMVVRNSSILNKNK